METVNWTTEMYNRIITAASFQMCIIKHTHPFYINTDVL